MIAARRTGIRLSLRTSKDYGFYGLDAGVCNRNGWMGTGMTVSVLTPENLVAGGASMVIAKADDGIEDSPVLTGLDSRWLLFLRGKELRFGYASGTQILIR